MWLKGKTWGRGSGNSARKGRLVTAAPCMSLYISVFRCRVHGPDGRTENVLKSIYCYSKFKNIKKNLDSTVPLRVLLALLGRNTEWCEFMLETYTVDTATVSVL